MCSGILLEWVVCGHSNDSFRELLKKIQKLKTCSYLPDVSPLDGNDAMN